jgi:hypothetical protein
MRQTHAYSHGIVSQLHVSEYVHLTAAPDAAIAVLVGGQILEDRFQRCTVRVSGIFLGHMRIAGNTERVISVDVPVEHEPVEVGVGDVAPEFAEISSTRPGIRADLGAFERTKRIHRH